MAASLRTLSLIAALALGLAACQQGADESADAKARGASAQAVTVASPQSRTLPRAITVSGPVAAVEEMQLGVELSGLRVTRLAVDVGQQVRRGQVLLTLDHRMLDADLVQANAALREAEAGAALARANLARGENLAGDKFISAMQLDELRAARPPPPASAPPAPPVTPPPCAAASPICARRRTASSASAWCSRARWCRPAWSCCA